MQAKPPVVVVLGHIDHGKSTLIDYIRKTNVTAKEAGGITQSIGAYQVSLGKGKAITFIDTPGHEAFEKMRSHGAKAADIAILVVAADEGVKPQTIEAIRDIKEAKIPLIVAINKMDAQGANPKGVKGSLSQHGVYLEGLGGDVPAAEVSAKTGKGVKELLDLILLMAEVEELKADPTIPAKGVVITSLRDSNRGVAATLVVKEGTLKEGAFVRLESTYGKIRAMHNFEGKRVKEAPPSTPVEVLGLEGLPEVGQTLTVVSSLEEARKELLPVEESDIPDNLITQEHVIKLILKSKEKASLDALEKLLSQVQAQQADINFQVIGRGVGDISLADVDLAHRFNALIIAFQTKVPSTIRPFVQQKQVIIKSFPLIHDLPPILEEIVIKTSIPKEVRAEKAEVAILAIFAKSKKGQVIGGSVTKGTLRRSAVFTIARGTDMIGKGKVVNLQHLKKDVSAVPQGKECGMLFQGDAEVKANDILIC